MDSFSVFFSRLNSLFTSADFVVRVGEVGPENEVFVRTIQVVRNDLNETQRLLGVKSIQKKLISTPSKLEWIKGAIYSTKSALNDIGKWVERARVDQQAIGKVKSDKKARYVFNDHEKLLDRKTELSACHQQLSNVLSFLVPLEEVPVSVGPPTYHATTFFDDVLPTRRSRVNEADPGGQPREMTLDYFPSSSITPDHESVLPPDALGVSVITTTASQTRSKTPSLIFDNTCSEADAPPPEYTSYDGRVSGGMRYPGLDDPGMSSSSQQYGSLAYSPNPSQEYVSDGTQVASDAKGPKRQIILSHTKSLALRGTNNHGPVNPLELFPDLNAEKKSQDTHATSKNNERYDIIQSVPVELPSDLPVELPSDLPVELPTVPLEKQLTELPAELPTNDSGPDPGYSRSIMRKPVPDLKPKSVQSQHEAPIPHRQAKIAPRPTSRTWQSNPTPQANPVSPTIHAPAFHYEMADPSSSVSLLSSARSTSISSVSSVPSPISSPVSSSFLTQKPSIQYGLHGSSSSVSLLSSPWSTSANSVPTGPSPISSPWQTSRNRPSVKPQTLSSPRMRNQKSYLDLLGIIDKS